MLPVNLKSPINSSADDFSMIIEKSGERGYLTSNRDGGKGGGRSHCFMYTFLLFVDTYIYIKYYPLSNL